MYFRNNVFTSFESLIYIDRGNMKNKETLKIIIIYLFYYRFVYVHRKTIVSKINA